MAYSFEKGPAVSEQDAMDLECNHHWLIASPNGPTSQGRCKLCGQHANFNNSFAETGWDGNGAHRRRVGQVRK